MEEEYNKFFQGLASIDPPQWLLPNILLQVGQAQKRAIKIRLGVLGLVALSSGAAIIPAFQYAAREFYQSGFYQYLSLLLSDGGIALIYWKEFGLSLAESLPVLGAAAFISAILGLFGSLEYLLENFKKYIRLANPLRY